MFMTFARGLFSKPSVRLLPTPERVQGAAAAPLRRQTVVEHVLVLAVSIAVVCWIYKPWTIDFSAPLNYGHDSMVILVWTKTVATQTWWLNNSMLGAPNGLQLHDFPLSSNVHFLCLKIMSVFTKNPATLVNVYFLLTFPLAAWTAYIAMRRMKLSFTVSLICANLFAVVPFHLLRATPHLFLSAYYFIPLFVMTLYCLMEEQGFLFTRDEKTGRLKFQWRQARTWWTVAILAAIASDFPYISLFAMVLLVPASVYVYSVRRRTESLYAAVLMVAVLGGVFLINISPTIIYHAQYGPNTSVQHVSNKPWTDGEYYGLKIIQLVMPSAFHNSEMMQRLNREYYTKTKIAGEADVISMGTLASVGFLFLLVRLCIQRRDTPTQRLLHYLSVLTIVAILFGSMGGFGTILNFLSMRVARCYSRISIFIVFFSLTATAILLQTLIDRLPKRTLARFSGQIALSALLVFGVWDQVGKLRKPSQNASIVEYKNDKEFVERIEEAVPPNTMIFQFPYISYCSYVNTAGSMEPYDHFRGYLHSHNLKWSFGAMHGRATDDLHQKIAELPLEQSLEMLATWGFSGIYIDRHGYADRGAEMEAKLAPLLQSHPIESGNQRLAYYSLDSYTIRMKETTSKSERQAKLKQLLNEPTIRWQKGAWHQEYLADRRPFRWCEQAGTFSIINPAAESRRVKLTFGAGSFYDGGFTLDLAIAGHPHPMPLRSTPQEYVLEFDLPAGHTECTWKTNAKAYVHPERTLHFMFIDMKCIADVSAAGRRESNDSR